MSNVSLSYDRLIESFMTWAAMREDIRAALVLGSRARSDRPADDYSDLDVAVFAADPMLLLQDAEWLKHIGEVWLTFIEPTALKNGY